MDAMIDDNRAELARSSGLSRSLLPAELSEKIQSWIQSPGSQILWINGAESPFEVSELSLLALHICTISMKAGVPCVSFLCKRRYHPTASADLAAPTANFPAVVLLLSLIRQLISLLPSEFQSKEPFDEAQFLSLKTDTNPFPRALGLFQSLLDLAPLPSLS